MWEAQNEIKCFSLTAHPFRKSNSNVIKCEPVLKWEIGEKFSPQELWGAAAHVKEALSSHINKPSLPPTKNTSTSESSVPPHTSRRGRLYNTWSSHSLRGKNTCGPSGSSGKRNSSHTCRTWTVSLQYGSAGGLSGCCPGWSCVHMCRRCTASLPCGYADVCLGYRYCWNTSRMCHSRTVSPLCGPPKSVTSFQSYNYRWNVSAKTVFANPPGVTSGCCAV